MSTQLNFHRILLKLSGEALMGDADYGIDPNVIGRLANEIIEVQRAGVEIGLVIGGGNIFRGAGLPLPAWIASPPITWACWQRS